MARKSSLDMKDLSMKLYPPTEAAFNKLLEASGYKSKRELFESMLSLYIASTEYLWTEELERRRTNIEALEKAQKEYSSDPGRPENEKKLQYSDFTLATERNELAEAEAMLANLATIREVGGDQQEKDLRYILQDGEDSYQVRARQVELFKLRTDKKYRHTREINAGSNGPKDMAWPLPPGFESSEGEEK